MYVHLKRLTELFLHSKQIVTFLNNFLDKDAVVTNSLMIILILPVLCV